MEPERDETGRREQLLDEVVAAYLEANTSGKTADRKDWLTRYPELAAELQEFFASQDQVNNWTGPLLPALRALGAVGSPSVDGALEAGKTCPAQGNVLGDYEILGPIAKGGMGMVFKARQRSLNRIVALKRILAGQFASVQELRRFRAEAEAVAQLDHPNIVPVYEVGEWRARNDGLPIHYFSMKLVEGGNLARHLLYFTRHPSAGARLLATVARAVHYAHQRGIMHRDLKPGNILLEELPGTPLGQWKPYITDFGLAKPIGGNTGLTLAGQVAGTPSYMAPEVAAGQKNVTTAVDVYSLGVILYEILTGRSPFRAETPLQTLRQVQENEPIPPRSLVSRLDRDLETICLKCLDKDPQGRYGSAEALAEDLERWLAGRPIQARRCNSWERLLKWTRRHPTTATLLVTVFVVAALGFTGVIWSWRETEEARRQLVLDRYHDHIALAEREWLANNAPRANELLDDCPAHLRGWEWYYLKRLNYTAPLVLRGHDSALYSVSFSPDGRRLASAGADGTVRIWDVATGKEIDILKAHKGPVRSLSFSPEGGCLATAGQDKRVKVWDTQTKQLLSTLNGHRVPLWSAAYSPDGNRIASSGGTDGVNGLGEVKIWDAAAGTVLYTLEGITQRVWTLSFSPDGKYLATGGRDQIVRLWDVTTGQEIRALRRHTMPVFRVVFSPDGQQLASAASAFDGVTKAEFFLWDVRTGQLGRAWHGHEARVTQLAFSPNGKRLASASFDKTVKLWDTTTGRETLTLRGHTDHVGGLAFSPDGQRLASAGEDNTVRLWDATPLSPDERNPLEEFALSLDADELDAVDISRDGTHVAWAGKDPASIRIWDVSRRQVVQTLRGYTRPVWRMGFSRDGLHLAAASQDGTIFVWNVRTGEIATTLSEPDGVAGRVVFSPDGRYLAYPTDRYDVKRRELPSGQERSKFSGHAWWVSSVAFSPDGLRLASGSYDQTTKIWDIQTGEELFTLGKHEGRVWSVAFSPDGKRLASGSNDATVKVWQLSSGKERLWLRGHADAVRAVAFSPDGHHLASASGDRTVKLWDAQSGQELFTFRGHSSRVRLVSFTKDGAQLLSASEGTRSAELKIWNLAPLLNKDPTGR